MFEEYFRVDLKDFRRITGGKAYTGVFSLLDDRLVLLWAHESMKFMLQLSYKDIISIFNEITGTVDFKQAVSYFLKAETGDGLFFQFYPSKAGITELKSHSLRPLKSFVVNLDNARLFTEMEESKEKTFGGKETILGINRMVEFWKKARK